MVSFVKFTLYLVSGSILVGGNLQEKLECQACPRGTVFVERERGALTMCRPCPSGTWMDQVGAVANKKGELGECNACADNAMTNVFPAYSADQCQKSKNVAWFCRTNQIYISASCFPNRTKFQVVFVLDSSGSVTQPEFNRMREFAKSVSTLDHWWKLNID